MWEVSNAGNRALYGSPDVSLGRFSSRALAFVQDYCEAMDKVDIQPRALATTQCLPEPELTKLNFDASSRHGTGYRWDLSCGIRRVKFCVVV